MMLGKLTITIVLGILAQPVQAVELRKEGRQNGGASIGPVVSNQHEFGMELDYYTRAAASSPPPFHLWRGSLGGHFWQAKDSGPDIFLDGGYCVGYLYYGCVMAGIRQHNKYASYANLTFELGTSFMLSVYFRPMWRLSRAADYKPSMHNAASLYEAGIKLKLPVYTF